MEMASKTHTLQQQKSTQIAKTIGLPSNNGSRIYITKMIEQRNSFDYHSKCNKNDQNKLQNYYKIFKKLKINC